MHEKTRISKSIADMVKISTDLKSTLHFAYIRTIFENIGILSIFDHLIPNHYLKSSTILQGSLILKSSTIIQGSLILKSSTSIHRPALSLKIHQVAIAYVKNTKP